MRVDDQVKRELDAVVGDKFVPPRRLRATLLKWVLFALLGVGAAAVVMTILHTHLTQAQTAPGPKKPVPIRIVPSQ
ncbi:MAG: hypothetical protein M3R58_15735 [Pseudomonadota bacterium]|nr:hypothetical protein [Pseudomonadota bacterium]